MKSVFRKELCLMARDGRVRMAVVMFLALLGGAIVVAAVEHDSFENEMALAGRSDHQHWVGQGEKDPHSATHYGQYVFRPRSDLHWMDRGLEDHLGTTIFLESHNPSAARNAAVEDRAWAPPFVDLSPSNLVLIVLPLMALVLGHAMWNGERREGTLATVVAAGADARNLLRGKILAVLATTAGLAWIASLLGLGVLLFHHDRLGDGFMRWALLAGVYSTSTFIYAALGVVASVAIRSPSKSLLTVLAFWAVTIVIAPRVMNSVAVQSHPLADQATIESWIDDMRANGIDGNDSRGARMARLRGEVLKKYDVSTMKDLPVNFSGLALQAGEEYDALIFDRVRERLEAQKQSRRSTRRWAYAMSPSSAAQSLSQLSAGSDRAHHDYFLAGAEARRRAYIKTLNDNLAFQSPKGARSQGTDQLWNETAMETLSMPVLTDLIHHALIPGIALIGWAILTFLLVCLTGRNGCRNPVATLGD